MRTGKNMRSDIERVDASVYDDQVFDFLTQRRRDAEDFARGDASRERFRL
jgi:hypothetical protein